MGSTCPTLIGGKKPGPPLEHSRESFLRGLPASKTGLEPGILFEIRGTSLVC